MQAALRLAEEGRGRVSPNPMVGCVIVRDGEIVGQGHHAAAGGPHAEVVALEQAADRARGATAYVTLEPCSHHGRTPPCTDALIAAGIKRVVFAVSDPGPGSGGAAALQAAGVQVTGGVLEAEAKRQNAAWLTFVTRGRPFVLYKTAMTLDGKIATRSGKSRWITAEDSRQRVQQWRDELDAVAVGVNTVLLDDPRLTSRLDSGSGRTPVKVIFDSVARTPVTAQLFEEDGNGVTPRVIIFATSAAGEARVEALRSRGAEVHLLDAGRGRPLVPLALEILAQDSITSVLLEGGGTLAWSFLEAGAIDRVAWFIAPKLLGGAGATPLGGMGVESMEDAFMLEDTSSEWLDTDLLITGKVVHGSDA